RARHVRRRPASVASAPSGSRRAPRPADGAAPRAGGRTRRRHLAGRGGRADRCARPTASAGRRRLRLPRAARLARAPARARRRPRRARRRDPRPARAGAAERRRALARRSRDRATAPRRHARRQAARALRGRRGRGAKRASAGARLARHPPHGAVDVRRLAACTRPLPRAERPMSFQSPDWLIALAAVPLLLGLYVLRERRRIRFASRFANPSLLPYIVDGAPGRRRHLPVALLVAGLAAMVVGVARPHADVTVPRREATVMLAVDVSRSMRATDVRPSRLAAAVGAAEAFLNEVPKTFRVGVVSFASRATLAVPGHRSRRRRRAVRAGGEPAADERRRHPADGGARRLGRCQGRRQDLAAGSGEEGEGAAHPRVHDRPRHALRRRPPDADGWVYGGHPRPSEPADAPAACPRDRRPVVHRARRLAAARGVRAAPLATRPAHGGPRDHGRVRRRRGRVAARRERAVDAVVQEDGVSRRLARTLALPAFAGAVLAAGASPAQATSECRALPVCVPVSGPWVVVPAGRGAPRPRVEYQLSCPRGYVVGGLDAELSDPAIDIAFLATLGSPVNPGISTSRAAVFVASSTATPA